jgi:histidine triad (HIT) family protein
MSSEKTIFQRIIDGEIPARIVAQDDLFLAFHDVNPQAPVHVLVIPKDGIRSLAEVTEADAGWLGQLMVFIRRVADSLELEQGYRVVTNIGPDGGQSVPHLHFHILGQRPLGWPPG